MTAAVSLTLLAAIGIALGTLSVENPVGPKEIRPLTRPPDTRRVALFGDSLALIAYEDFERLAVADRVEFHAWLGYSMQDHIDAIESLHATFPIVVLALGTNDAVAPDLNLAAWQRAFEALRGTCVMLIIPFEQGNVPSFVAAVRELASEYSNITEVDWNRAVQPEWQGPDGVHHSEIGSIAYANALGKAVELAPIVCH